MLEKLQDSTLSSLLTKTFHYKISRFLELPMMQRSNISKLYSSSSLIAFTYMMHKSKHYLLGNLKQLTSIKLLKTVIYKTYVSILYHYHMHSIFCSNQTPINLFEQLSKQI